MGRLRKQRRKLGLTLKTFKALLRIAGPSRSELARLAPMYGGKRLK